MLTKETDICKKVSAYHHYDVVHGVSKYWICASLCGLVIKRRWIVRDDDEPISCKLCLRILGRGGYSGSGKLEGKLKCFAKITLKLRDLGKEIFVLSVATSHNSIRMEKEDMM